MLSAFNRKIHFDICTHAGKWCQSCWLGRILWWCWCSIWNVVTALLQLSVCNYQLKRKSHRPFSNVWVWEGRFKNGKHKNVNNVIEITMGNGSTVDAIFVPFPMLWMKMMHVHCQISSIYVDINRYTILIENQVRTRPTKIFPIFTLYSSSAVSGQCLLFADYLKNVFKCSANVQIIFKINFTSRSRLKNIFAYF